MSPRLLRPLCAAALAALAAGALAQAPIVNPGAPGAEPRPLRPDEAIALARTAARAGKATSRSSAVS